VAGSAAAPAEGEGTGRPEVPATGSATVGGTAGAAREPEGGSSRKSPEPEVTVTDSEGSGSAGRLICEGRERCDS
jgi:hypothetical protein